MIFSRIGPEADERFESFEGVHRARPPLSVARLSEKQQAVVRKGFARDLAKAQRLDGLGEDGTVADRIMVPERFFCARDVANLFYGAICIPQTSKLSQVVRTELFSFRIGLTRSIMVAPSPSLTRITAASVTPLSQTLTPLPIRRTNGRPNKCACCRSFFMTVLRLRPGMREPQCVSPLG